MKILAIETSTLSCSVAVCEGKRIAARHEEIERAHARLVLPMIRSALAEMGRRVQDLDVIAFGAGPGSFTGVRIALSVAQGLALAADLPLVGVSSLAVLAQGVLAAHPRRKVLVAQDARMREVYAGGYHLEDGLATAAFDDCVISATDLPDSSGWLLAGDAWHRVPALMAQRNGRKPLQTLPSALYMLPLAASLVENGFALPAEQAQPHYLRNTIAATR